MCSLDAECHSIVVFVSVSTFSHFITYRLAVLQQCFETVILVVFSSCIILKSEIVIVLEEKLFSLTITEV